MKKFPIKHDGGLERAKGSRPVTATDALARGGADSPGTATVTRIIELLIQATSEGKIHWFRDAEYFAVTYFPMLAASFRLQITSPNNYNDGVFHATSDKLDPSKARHLSVAFIDNKEFRCLASQYPKLNELSTLVWSTFKDDFQRDRNERLEWLEKALRMFLPHVVSSSVEPNDQM